jgi:NAD(P)-dependent dehydrogenase (short-subunit alcohol dehydrogenase family)
MVAYTASKHAVIGLTRTAASEVARHGIRVNAICPGSTETRMTRSISAMANPADPEAARRVNAANTPTGRYTQPEEVAQLVLYLCSDQAANITGSHFVIDGGRTGMISVFQNQGL